ncbi:unnamed protein product [Periconia digitata]|uniref:Uncharacterized protein n=1 Tax=Periconia digitata TaxID=1303443 RepID=A0A9W4XJQ7_9PLEO|nr:unnamed protein product [Periconia digitata]
MQVTSFLFGILATGIVLVNGSPIPGQSFSIIPATLLRSIEPYEENACGPKAEGTIDARGDSVEQSRCLW